MVTISCKHPIFIKKNGLIVPCGKCFKCRQKYRLSWQLRLQHELISYQGTALFLTLTYNNENLPSDNNLVKKDVQDFMKRLRKYYKDIKIRYFFAGEYGTKKQRPHYHAIIYGLRAPEHKKKSILNWKYAKFLADNIWKKGYCFVGYVDKKCINYVSKYIMKKYYIDGYMPKDLVQPFTLKSAGIGLSWLKEHMIKVCDDIYTHKTVKVFNARIGYPRYYRKKLVEYGLLMPNFSSTEYYEQIDNLQPSIISELKESNIKLDYLKNYLYVSLTNVFNLESYTIMSITKDLKVSLKKYTKDYNFYRREREAIPEDMLHDILDNHWFFIYLNYLKALYSSAEYKFKKYNIRKMEESYVEYE